MNEITIDENHLTFVDDLIKVVELKLLQEQSSQEIAENTGKIYCPTTREEVVNAMIEVIQRAELKDKVIEDLTDF
jgi:hypothetical protein|tara:strand:+ start:283 stop:507 length:225 start_codon:yes stop_codon:yes gene_type:complete